MMGVESLARCEKMRKPREELLTVEDGCAAGCAGCTPDDPDAYLDEVIDMPEKEKDILM